MQRKGETSTTKTKQTARPAFDLDFRPRSYRWPRKLHSAGAKPNATNEVVIARVRFATSHGDAISLRARRSDDGRIRYRMVHDDAHGRANRPIRTKPAASDRPLSFGELVQLLDSACYHGVCSNPDDQERFGGLIWGTLQLHFEHGIDHADAYLSFTTITSEHYPQLDAYYAERMSEWCLANCEEEEDCKRIVRLRRRR